MQSAETHARLLLPAMVYDVSDNRCFVSLLTAVPTGDSVVPFQQQATFGQRRSQITSSSCTLQAVTLGLFTPSGCHGGPRMHSLNL